MGHSMESSRPIMAPSVSDRLALLLAHKLQTPPGSEPNRATPGEEQILDWLHPTKVDVGHFQAHLQPIFHLQRSPFFCSFGEHGDNPHLNDTR